MAGDDWISTSPIALSQPLRARELTPGRTLTKQEVRDQRRRALGTETSNFQALSFTQKSLFDGTEPVASVSAIHLQQEQRVRSPQKTSTPQGATSTAASPKRKRDDLAENQGTPRRAVIEEYDQPRSSAKGKQRASYQEEIIDAQPLFQSPSSELPDINGPKKSKKQRTASLAEGENSADEAYDRPNLASPPPPPTASTSQVKHKQSPKKAKSSSGDMGKAREGDAAEDSQPNRSVTAPSPRKPLVDPEGSAVLRNGQTSTKRVSEPNDEADEAEEDGPDVRDRSRKALSAAKSKGKRKTVKKGKVKIGSFLELFTRCQQSLLEALNGEKEDGAGNESAYESVTKHIREVSNTQSAKWTSLDKTRHRREDAERQSVEVDRQRRILAEKMRTEQSGWRDSRRQLRVNAGLQKRALQLHHEVLDDPDGMDNRETKLVDLEGVLLHLSRYKG